MCEHQNLRLINPYELIRKYLCKDCGGVMMCSSDKEFSEEFFPHQLANGTDLDTKEVFQVSLGFQDNICEECRQLPISAFPKAEIYGSTSKIKRYYWRELSIETTKLFGAWAKEKGYSDWMLAWRENAEKHKEIERQALAIIKELHRTSPKYNYSEKSQQEVIDEYEVEVENLFVQYSKNGSGPKGVAHKGLISSAEDYAKDVYEERGFKVIQSESIPFHVLFGAILWSLIQDPNDAKVQPVGFGRRDDWQKNGKLEQIWTPMPQDFGSKGYGNRRDNDIKKFLSRLPETTMGMLDLFDASLSRSADIRQYLWAHEKESIEKARVVIEIVPTGKIIDILDYLVRDYWRRYLGWPDLIISDGSEYGFVEVKASKDKLSEVQKNWISDNYKHLHMPFNILKLHKKHKHKGQ